MKCWAHPDSKMGLFMKCDSCGLTTFSGKERVINGTKLFLCQHCFRVVVAVSALADLKIVEKASS